MDHNAEMIMGVMMGRKQLAECWQPLCLQFEVAILNCWKQLWEEETKMTANA